MASLTKYQLRDQQTVREEIEHYYKSLEQTTGINKYFRWESKVSRMDEERVMKHLMPMQVEEPKDKVEEPNQLEKLEEKNNEPVQVEKQEEKPKEVEKSEDELKKDLEVKTQQFMEKYHLKGATIFSVDAHQTEDKVREGFVVLITGSAEYQGVPTKYAQFILLNSAGLDHRKEHVYYVHRDILRYLDEEATSPESLYKDLQNFEEKVKLDIAPVELVVAKSFIQTYTEMFPKDLYKFYADSSEVYQGTADEQLTCWTNLEGIKSMFEKQLNDLSGTQGSELCIQSVDTYLSVKTLLSKHESPLKDMLSKHRSVKDIAIIMLITGKQGNRLFAKSTLLIPQISARSNHYIISREIQRFFGSGEEPLQDVSDGATTSMLQEPFEGVTFDLCFPPWNPSIATSKVVSSLPTWPRTAPVHLEPQYQVAPPLLQVPAASALTRSFDLSIFNLPPSIQEMTLRNEFRRFGTILPPIKIEKDERNLPLCYAVIKFAARGSRDRALDEVTAGDFKIRGHTIYNKPAGSRR